MASTLSGDGTWSVHQRPRSLRISDKTFIGSVSSTGEVEVTEYDHAESTAETTTIGSVFSDDHSSPSFYQRTDDYLIAFWTDRDTQKDVMFWSISDNPLDASSWGAVQTFSSSGGVIDYPQPVEWNGNLRLYYRRGSGDGAWVFRDSTDGGSSFGSPTDFVADSTEDWVYIHTFRDGSKLHFALGDHRMTNPAIRHWYLENGDYHDSGGSLIQSASTAITDISDLTLVFDGSDTGNNPPKQYDLICDSSGNPHVAFTEHVSTGTGGGDGDYRARWAGWDGSQWVVGSEVVPMGGALPESHYYEGGLSLDSQDPTTVYVSVEQSNRNYQVQEWSTNDDGSTWSKVADLSSADASNTDPTKRGRPISPRNHDNGELTVTWWAGRYDDYTDFDTDIQAKDSLTVANPDRATKYIRRNGNWTEMSVS